MEKIINVCYNLKRELYLGTKKKQKGGYIKGRREYYKTDTLTTPITFLKKEM